MQQFATNSPPRDGPTGDCLVRQAVASLNNRYPVQQHRRPSCPSVGASRRFTPRSFARDALTRRALSGILYSRVPAELHGTLNCSTMSADRSGSMAFGGSADMAEEIWKLIPGFDRYEVSNLGRVRFVRMLSPSHTRFGYKRTSLTPDGDLPSGRLIHRLVLEAFVGPCPPGMEGCHNNGIRDDNRLENLRWDTSLANAKDRELHGTLARGERSGNARLTIEQVRVIRASRGQCPAAVVARMFGCCPRTIRDIWGGRSWKGIE